MGVFLLRCLWHPLGPHPLSSPYTLPCTGTLPFPKSLSCPPPAVFSSTRISHLELCATLELPALSTVPGSFSHPAGALSSVKGRPCSVFGTQFVWRCPGLTLLSPQHLPPLLPLFSAPLGASLPPLRSCSPCGL